MSRPSPQPALYKVAETPLVFLPSLTLLYFLPYAPLVVAHRSPILSLPVGSAPIHPADHAQACSHLTSTPSL